MATDKEKQEHATQVLLLEQKIYDRYYKLNPNGDARCELWPLVIKAKASPDPIVSLRDLFSNVDSVS